MSLRVQIHPELLLLLLHGLAHLEQLAHVVDSGSKLAESLIDVSLHPIQQLIVGFLALLHAQPLRLESLSVHYQRHEQLRPSLGLELPFAEAGHHEEGREEVGGLVAELAADGALGGDGVEDAVLELGEVGG